MLVALLVRAIRSTTELNGEASSRRMYGGHRLRILTLPKNGRFIRENSRFLLPHNSGRPLKSSNTYQARLSGELLNRGPALVNHES
jgi:hypothetical protein